MIFISRGKQQQKLKGQIPKMQIFAQAFQHTMKSKQSKQALKAEQILLRDYIISYNFRKSIKMQHFFNQLKQERGITDPALYWELNDGLNNNFEKYLEERIKKSKKLVRGLIDDDKIFAVIQKIFEELKNFFIDHLSSNRKNIELIKSIFNTNKPPEASSIAYAPMVSRSSKHPSVVKQKLHYKQQNQKDDITAPPKDLWGEKKQVKLPTKSEKDSVKPLSTDRATSAPKQLESARSFITKQQLKEQAQQKPDFFRNLIQKSRKKNQEQRSAAQRRLEKVKSSQEMKKSIDSENPEKIEQSLIQAKNKGFEDVIEVFDDYGMRNIKKDKEVKQKDKRQQKIQKKAGINHKRSKSQAPQRDKSLSSEAIGKADVENQVQEMSFEQMKRQIRQRRKLRRDSRSQSKSSIFDGQQIQSAKEIRLLDSQTDNVPNIKVIAPSPVQQKESPKTSKKYKNPKKHQQVPKTNIQTRRLKSTLKDKEVKTQAGKFKTNFVDKQLKGAKKQLRRKQTLKNRDFLGLGGQAAQLQLSQLRMSRIQEDSDDQDRNQIFDDPFKVLEFFGL